MVAVCGQASAWPGSKFPGIPTPRTAATQSRRKDRGSSNLKLGVSCMLIRILSRIPASALRRPTPVASPSPAFYPIDSQALAECGKQEGFHD
ncbi:hypothetical protein DZC75_18695 [Pseudomonas parafulva]|uniref:Uncharacterized protein n=1 Tax=Pseudomonas parafulva TaxID=157782 RepID=A0AAI8KEX5_9PSED|nr:hypothetical protein DZC75_18660 [Pseudomonas parafulva]AXO89933.1 hypothetical protein DZC75_18695 [Pseudomonas parafulva]